MNKTKTAVLLINLGSPSAPTAQAVRPYLRQFLSDRRVVEVNPILWNLILRLAILPFRSPVSAKRYESVWLPEGSPLIVYTERLAKKLQKAFDEEGSAVKVAFAMRYGEPDQDRIFRELHEKEGFDNIVVLPLYPQYSATTTASVADILGASLAKMRSQPHWHLISDYHDNPEYARAIAASIKAHWKTKGELGEKDRLVLSFHGMPKRYCDLGDPYDRQVRKSAQMIIDELGIAPEEAVIAYQSRFGKEEWLQPYLTPQLERLAAEGVERVDILCPGFSIDCLETLEEVSDEARQTFLSKGGKEYNYIECLNDSSDAVSLIKNLVSKHL